MCFFLGGGRAREGKKKKPRPPPPPPPTKKKPDRRQKVLVLVTIFVFLKLHILKILSALAVMSLACVHPPPRLKKDRGGGRCSRAIRDSKVTVDR